MPKPPRFALALLAVVLTAVVTAAPRVDLTPGHGLAAGSPLPASPTSGTIVLVEIVDFAFAPRRIEITAGDTVRWKNLDLSPHSVISDEDGEPVDSGRMDRGAGFRHRFDTPGTFNYECGFHQNMGGIVVVRPADPATPTA